MDRKYLIRAIKIALREADRKPIDEAAEIIADNIRMVEEIMEDIPMPIKSEVKTNTLDPVQGGGAEAPPAPSTPAGTKAASDSPSFVPTRTYREPQELMAEVAKEMPEMIEVTRPGKDPIRAARSITAMQQQEGGYFGVQVSYPAPGIGPQGAFPKVSFWITQEDLEFPKAIASAQDQAQKIYAFQPKAVVQNKTPPPGERIKMIEV